MLALFQCMFIDGWSVIYGYAKSKLFAELAIQLVVPQ